MTQLITILAAVRECKTYEIWQRTFGQIDDDDMLYVHGEYEQVNDATLSYSLLSLRKVDEFLTDYRAHPTDLKYSDFSIDKAFILNGESQLISTQARRKINKCVAHLTESGELDVDEFEDLIQELNAAKPHLERLDKEVSRILRA